MIGKRCEDRTMKLSIRGLRLGILILGMATVATAGAQTRAVDIRDHARLLRIIGSDSSDRCGIGLDVGDVNMDGLDDLLIGSDRALDTTRNNPRGRVDLFYSQTLDVFGEIDLYRPQPVPDLTFYGESSGSRFGLQIQHGDYDGNNITDLALAAPYYNLNDQNSTGRIYLFFGESIQPPTRSINIPSSAIVINGAEEAELAGFKMATADFDQDGLDELILGAPGSARSGSSASGTVYVVHGRTRSQWAAVPRLNLANATQDATTAAQIGVRAFLGKRQGDRLGESLAVGDINGDGVADLFLGADHQDYIPRANQTFLDVGMVHMIDGTKVLSSYSPFRLRETKADTTFIGKSEFDLYGDNIELFNWDGDTGGAGNLGTQDLWISAPFAEPKPYMDISDDRGLLSMISGSLDFPQEHAGAEIRFPSQTTTLLVGPRDPGNETLFAGDLEFGDVVDDVTPELIASCSQYDRESLDRYGAVYILDKKEVDEGTVTTPFEVEYATNSIKILGESTNGHFGFRTRILRHPSGNRLVISAPQATVYDRSAAGAVYILDIPSLAFDPDTGPTPTHQNTPTWTPTHTQTITLTPTPTLTLTPTPTETTTITLTPTEIPVTLLDLNADEKIDSQDLILLSSQWMSNPKNGDVRSVLILLGMLNRLQSMP
jgi:hypothetical protein